MGRILAAPYTTGELMSWFDASGTEWPLNGDAYLFLDNPGRKGFKGLPPMATTVLQTPLVDGDTPRFTLAQPRPLEVHALIQGSNQTDFETVRTQLQNAMNPKRGDGYFRATRADGVMRDIFCRYDSGFEGDESWGVSSSVYEEVLLKFVAHDPYWYDTLATVLTFPASAATNFFPITPLKLSSSSVLGNNSIYNGGDAEAYPVWTITGPGTNPILTNGTTGKAITTTVTLAAGETLVIDTQAKTARIPQRTPPTDNLFSALSFASVLWTLVVGQNAISVTMGATAAGSQIQVSYKQRWNSL